MSVIGDFMIQYWPHRGTRHDTDDSCAPRHDTDDPGGLPLETSYTGARNRIPGTHGAGEVAVPAIMMISENRRDNGEFLDSGGQH